ncbi:MAG: carbohydrate kinase [Saprospiraceae bacterium]
MTNTHSIVCFGEALWDMLPSGKVPGGAPMNVAIHAKNFGMDAHLISAVGNDELGESLLRFIQQKGISTDLIHRNFTFDTSTVQVTLDKKGIASYDIVKPVAWDFLSVKNEQKAVVKKSDYLLFGSLIVRSNNNFVQLQKLIEKAQKTVFDVNLRPPFYSQSEIESLLQKANIVKLNDDELDIIAGWYDSKNTIADQMDLVKNKFNIDTLVMTQGKHGAYCLHNETLFQQNSFSVKVKDTVGSGDSFLAAFLYKMSQGVGWQECLKFACAMGALVATKSGATPTIDEKMVQEFIAQKANHEE